MQLTEELQARMDTFHYKFGVGAEMDENRIWIIENIAKPEHERVRTTINGSVISKMIFNGYYSIEDGGRVEDTGIDGRIEARRKKAKEASAAVGRQEPSPLSKKVKDKE